MGALRPVLTELVAAARRRDGPAQRRLMLEAKILVVSLDMEVSMFESSINELETDGRTKRRGGSRRSNGQAPAVTTIPLTPEQVEKLWRIVVGGRLVIDQDEETHAVVCHVSVDSFHKALPVLLERL